VTNDLSGALGDIFWDLSPSVSYTPGSELGCTIYVANPTEEVKEYSLMCRLISDTTLISEEVIRVYGYTWFTVDPGEFIRLHGAMKFEDTDVVLVVQLMERSSDEVADSVATYLVSPAAGVTPGWPYMWPGGPTAVGTDWSWLLTLMMMAAMGVMVAETVGEGEEEKKLPSGREY
jgi:hypothetical protein